MHSQIKIASFSFAPGLYLLRVRKVELDSDPGFGRETGSRTRFDLEVFRPTDEGLFEGYNERIEVFQDLQSEGVRPGSAFADFLRNLGVDPEDTPPDQYDRCLRGRFVMGRLGEPGVGRYQSIIESARCEVREAERRLRPRPAVAVSAVSSCIAPSSPDGTQPRCCGDAAGRDSRRDRPEGATTSGSSVDGAIETRPTSLLCLKGLGGRGENKRDCATLSGRLDGTSLEIPILIGHRQLFFLFLLFNSRRLRTSAEGIHWTVVSEAEAVEQFIKWVDQGFLQFGTRDREAPKTRVTKCWDQFIRQMGRHPGLKDLFKAFPTDEGEKVYAIRLREAEMNNHLPSFDELPKVLPLPVSRVRRPRPPRR
jgi:hypothetical protein